MAKLIGITGHKGSGKDTAVETLEGWDTIKFADCLKLMLKQYLVYCGMSYKEAGKLLEDPELKNKPHPLFHGKTPRYAMQTLGTEWGRTLINPDIWVYAAMNHVKDYRKAVITDVRFPNEAKAVKDAGGTLVRINKPRGKICVSDFHPSETAIDKLEVDHQITNDDSIEALRSRLHAIAQFV